MSYQLNYLILGENNVIPFKTAENENVYDILERLAEKTRGRVDPETWELWLVGDTYCTGQN